MQDRAFLVPCEPIIERADELALSYRKMREVYGLTRRETEFNTSESIIYTMSSITKLSEALNWPLLKTLGDTNLPAVKEFFPCVSEGRNHRPDDDYDYHLIPRSSVYEIRDEVHRDFPHEETLGSGDSKDYDRISEILNCLDFNIRESGPEFKWLSSYPDDKLVNEIDLLEKFDAWLKAGYTYGSSTSDSAREMSDFKEAIKRKAANVAELSDWHEKLKRADFNLHYIRLVRPRYTHFYSGIEMEGTEFEYELHRLNIATNFLITAEPTLSHVLLKAYTCKKLELSCRWDSEESRALTEDPFEHMKTAIQQGEVAINQMETQHRPFRKMPR